jgi:RNA polymerase sigma-70 factor (ECF subfamily)
MGLPVEFLGRDVGDKALLLAPLGDEVCESADRDVDGPQRDRQFAEMAGRNARFMFRVAHGLLRSVQDAEDAVQDALLKLYRGDAWRRMENERAFLARTVWRTGLDVAARRPKNSEPVETGESEPAATDATPEQSAAEGEERALLRRLIEALPEELRQPLVLSAIEEMTSREVAAVMGIPEGTVRTRVMRAKAELKRRFEAMRLRQTTTAD